MKYIAEIFSKINRLSIWHFKVKVLGMWFIAPTLDRLVYLLLHRFSLMGKTEKVFLNNIIKRGDNVVDIGANIGVYTLLFSKIVGKEGKVFAFEPNPELHDALVSNCKENDVENVEIYNFALGAESARHFLQCSPFNAGDNRLSVTDNQSDMLSQIVDVARLDEVLCNESIDFVKIDVQGWECEVLSGMKNIFDKDMPRQLYLEYWPYGLRKAGANPIDLFNMLGTRGFSLYTTDNNIEVEESNYIEFTDNIHGKRYTNIYATRDKN